VAFHKPLVLDGGEVKRIPDGDQIDPGSVVAAPIGPLLSYASGRLDRIDYDDGSYKQLSYDAGNGYRLQRIDYVRGAATTRKDFSYNLDGTLHEIVQTEL